MNKFHIKCGDRVTLLNENLTAIRNFLEFNHGLILSADPLTDDVLFEVRIDRKSNVWNGSLEIGVTTLDPESLELPATATKLRNTAWILSGNSIVKDGVMIVNTYGPELDSLGVGDCIAVSRSSKGELMYFINGRCLGIAAKDLPARLFAVIDLYGQCIQVSIVHRNYPIPMTEQPSEGTSSEAGACALTRSHRDTHIEMPITCPLVSQDNLRFHPRCGLLVKLSNNNKSAERARPLDDYNNGVAMTHRPLCHNELFEIRIDKLVDKWSGSIEVGVTTHNPATIRFPSTMTNMETGTIMLSGCKVLMNGQGACMEYGNFNLDELKEGDRVAMMKKADGKLHYFINGVDQGMATDQVPQLVWGVVDLYGMTVKVTVIDPCEDMGSNINAMPQMLATPEVATTSQPADGAPVASVSTIASVASGLPPAAVALDVDASDSPHSSVQMPAEEPPAQPSTSSYEPPGCTGMLDEVELLFHTLRDSHVIIINHGRTAHRPNAFETFNNGFVMTNRTLKTNELFQVRLDLVIPKWAGSIEIGVTQHSSNDIRFPFRMINATSGTWGMTGEDVFRDGKVIIPKYVRNLSRLREGDTVGVMRKDMGILHFYLNGVDQGPAAFNIPEHVFGMVDLYGRVAQITIVDLYTPLPISSPESPISLESNATILPEMCFHRVHGHNARLSRSRLTASRATVYSEFNDAVLFSSRPLRECDMFEIRIDKMVDCWIGSLEIGVTALRPDDLAANGGLGALAGTATDLSWGTYILSGSAMMKDGECVRSGYPLDLDSLTVGSRVGMMWRADRSLHYYLDGMDLGKAWNLPHLNIYAVVDLYGQCTQVTILQNEERAFNYNGCNTDHGIPTDPSALPTPPPPYWSFSEYHGDNVTLSKDFTTARRLTPDPMGALVFSSAHLVVDELFEIQILECKHSYAGSFRMGITDVNVLNANINRHLPLCVSWLPHFTAYIDGKYMKYSRPDQSRNKDLHSFVPSFEWLRPGDRIGLKKTSDSKVLVYYNSELLEVAFEKVPDKVYVLMELYGTTTKIQTVSRGVNVLPGTQQTIPNDKPETKINTEAPSATIMSEPKKVPTVTDVDQTETRDESDESPSLPQTDLPDEENACALPDDVEVRPEEPVASTSSGSGMVEVLRQRRPGLPYTFHFITGNNIRLCSSDTVALRFRGYSDAVAVASQPLRRGEAFRFRVDKVSDEWEGTVCIGALAMLPTEMPPSTALHFAIPCWTLSEIGRKLEQITENSVLTLHFRFSSELTLEIDGVLRGVIATIPRSYNDIYPTIDLYGRVVQVSILLHPRVILGGTSLDLPMIEENGEVSPEDEASALLEDTDTNSDADRDDDAESDADADAESDADVDPYADVDQDPDYEPNELTPSSDEPDDYFSYTNNPDLMRSRGNNASEPIDDTDENDTEENNTEENDADQSGNITDDDSNPTDDVTIPHDSSELVDEYEPLPGPSTAPDGPGPNTAPDGPRPSTAPDGPGPSTAPDGPGPSSAPDGPGPDTASDGPGPKTAPDGPGPSTAPDVPGPSSAPDGPGPKTAPDGPGPSTAPDGPGPSTAPDGPGPCTAPDGPGPSTAPDGPGPSTTPDGPGPNTAPDGPGPSTAPDGPGPSTAPDGPGPCTAPDVPGPSTAPDGPEASANDARNSEIKALSQDRTWPLNASIHESLLLLNEYMIPDNDLDAEYRDLKKSVSTQHLSPGGASSDDSSYSYDNSMMNPLIVGLHFFDEDSDHTPVQIDTNILHNHRYPEANEIDSNEGNDAYDNFENVFFDAMSLNTNIIPDLNVDQSLYAGESTMRGRENYWADDSTVEELHYMNGIICWDQSVTGALVEHRDWVYYSETNGNCEVMHLALKYFNQIIAPYSDMREVVTGGNVHCFCSNCDPEANPLHTGWVRIERAKVTTVACSQPVRMYWHVIRATIIDALALRDSPERNMRRPLKLCTEPSTNPPFADSWMDEEGKPHRAALALDIDVGGQEVEDDRLLAYWIYLKSHALLRLDGEEVVNYCVSDSADVLEEALHDIVETTLDDNDSDVFDEVAAAPMDDTLDLDDDDPLSEPEAGAHE